MAINVTLPSFSPTKDPRQYKIFTGALSRWIWRILVQRLTAPGRWFAFITAVFVAYGGGSLQLQGYVLAGYAAALWIVAVVAMVFYRPKVRLIARLANRVYAGETLPVEIEVEQVGRFEGADLLVMPHQLGPTLDAVPDAGVLLPDLRRGERARVRIGLKCNKRGSFILRGFRVETGFPFGLLRGRRTFNEPRQILVYPKFTPLARLALPTGRRYQPGGVAMVSQVGESFEYLGNREYREGDNVRDIDWRATARTQRPIIREWVEEYMLRVAVLLDTHVPKGLLRKEAAERAAAFERAISITAAVSDYMARQDYLVDLFAAGPNLYHLTAGRSLAYLDQILDILACVDENPDEPFEVIEPQIADLLSRLSTVICVMLDWNETRRAFVHRLLSQGVAVKVIILRDAPCAADPSNDAEVLGPVPIIGQQEFERGIDDL